MAAGDRGPATMIVIGAGQRGKTYARYALEKPDVLRVVGVAEPRDFHRSLVKRQHDIPAENVFRDWREVAERPRFADAVCIATQDSMHTGPAVELAKLGYHILLEKPMAATPEDCHLIVETVKRAGVILAVGHVLRYTPYFRKIREVIDSGAIGEVVNVQHLEPIGSWHFAHSYVRGQWRREDESSFMLMAKCCHDIDLLRAIVDRPFRRVSSFGGLYLFRPEKRPEGAAARCLDCPLRDECPYSATRIYLEQAQAGFFHWPVSTILDGTTSVEAVEEALREGPYGRCVWASDNDVADHQVVAMEFEGGVSATLTTTAFTEAVCQRRTRIFGTMGEIDGNGNDEIRVYNFSAEEAITHKCDGPPKDTMLRGHNGADFFLIDAFARAVQTGDRSAISTGPDETLESHLAVFAAEHARRTGTVVEMEAIMDPAILELSPPTEEPKATAAAAAAVSDDEF